MPWYDYQCEKCGAVFEVNRSMSDTGKVKCHACGSARTIRIYAASPIVFKGSGFYATDSGHRSSSMTTSTETSGSETNGKTETETAAPTPQKPTGSKRKSA